MFRKILFISLIVAGAAFAQGKGGGSRTGGSEGNNGAMMPNAPPSKFDIICTSLNLTKDQKKAVKTSIDEAAKEAVPLRDQMSKARIAIADAVQNKKTDEEIAGAINAYGALATQMATLEVNTFGKIYAGLDDTQKSNRNGINTVFALMKNIFANKNWNED